MPARELRPNPKNWRTHPKAQQDALRGLLAEIGFADALLARIDGDGSLILIDGHLRAETAADELVPVLILDVDEAEAAKILATLDPLGAMADADEEKLTALLGEIETGSAAVQAMLDSLGKERGAGENAADGEAEVPENNYREQYGVIVICDSEEAQQLTYEELKHAGYECKVVTT